MEINIKFDESELRRISNLIDLAARAAGNALASNGLKVLQGPNPIDDARYFMNKFDAELASANRAEKTNGKVNHDDQSNSSDERPTAIAN